MIQIEKMADWHFPTLLLSQFSPHRPASIRTFFEQ
jgi:hypothetical protein